MAVSDGYSDECRRQERYFDAMRVRLLAEELLYGSYNPETCPNLVRQEDDWCVPDGCFCGPCHAMWCEGCHAHTGPWGAWRAVAGGIRDCLAHATTIPYNETGPYTIHRPYELLAAVGWSP